MPSSGPSATVLPNPATSDANNSSVNGTANTIARIYTVGVNFSGITTPTSFRLTNPAGPAASVGQLFARPAKHWHLRNLAANDPILANGFDTNCLPFTSTLEGKTEAGK